MPANCPIDAFFDRYGDLERVHDRVAESLATETVDKAALYRLREAIYRYDLAAKSLETALACDTAAPGED